MSASTSARREILTRSSACRAGLNLAPEPPEPHTQRDENEDAHASEERHHHAVGHHDVEVAGRPAETLGIHGPGHDQHQQRQHRNKSQGRGYPVVPERRAKGWGPAMVLVRAHTDPGERLGHVDPEFVRRRKLTGVQALTAVVAEVGEIGQVRFCEQDPLFHRREHRAVLLAVPAGVAHGHHVFAPRELRERRAVSEPHAAPLLPPPRVRRPCRSSSRFLRRIPCAGRCRP